MNYMLIALMLVVVVLLYILYLYVYGSSTKIASQINLNKVNPAIAISSDPKAVRFAVGCPLCSLQHEGGSFSTSGRSG